MLMVLLNDRKLKEVVSETGSGGIDQPVANAEMDEPLEPVKTVKFHTTQVTIINVRLIPSLLINEFEMEFAYFRTNRSGSRRYRKKSTTRHRKLERLGSPSMKTSSPQMKRFLLSAFLAKDVLAENERFLLPAFFLVFVSF